MGPGRFLVGHRALGGCGELSRCVCVPVSECVPRVAPGGPGRRPGAASWKAGAAPSGRPRSGSATAAPRRRPVGGPRGASVGPPGSTRCRWWWWWARGAPARGGSASASGRCGGLSSSRRACRGPAASASPTASVPLRRPERERGAGVPIRTRGRSSPCVAVPGGPGPHPAAADPPPRAAPRSGTLTRRSCGPVSWRRTQMADEDDGVDFYDFLDEDESEKKSSKGAKGTRHAAAHRRRRRRRRCGWRSAADDLPRDPARAPTRTGDGGGKKKGFFKKLFG